MSPRRRLLVAALAVAVVLGAVAALAVGVARGPGAGLGPVAPGGTPVLVVPGYNGSPESVGTLAARLRSAGRPVVVVDLPDRATGDLRASATALAAAVDRTGAARVDLVGYSAGGVVIRLWLADPARALRARRVVLLGTPNHGTELAGAAAAPPASSVPWLGVPSSTTRRARSARAGSASHNRITTPPAE